MTSQSQTLLPEVVDRPSQPPSGSANHNTVSSHDSALRISLHNLLLSSASSPLDTTARIPRLQQIVATDRYKIPTCTRPRKQELLLPFSGRNNRGTVEGTRAQSCQLCSGGLTLGLPALLWRPTGRLLTKLLFLGVVFVAVRRGRDW